MKAFRSPRPTVLVPLVAMTAISAGASAAPPGTTDRVIIDRG